jgi:hypothetical protein
VRRMRLALLTLGVLSLLLIAATAHASVNAQAAPTASQLLAKTKACTVASKSKYKTDDETSATINICRSGSAYFWKADMDIDCDGISTSNCNRSKDPCEQVAEGLRAGADEVLTRPFEPAALVGFLERNLAWASNGGT